MSVDVAFEMKGFDGLFAKLNTVKAELRQRIVQNATLAGARVVRDEARARIPVRSGLTRAAIRVFARRTGVGRNEVVAAVGVRGAGKKGRAHIARWLEYGTAAHMIEAGGVSRPAAYAMKKAAFEKALRSGATTKQALRLSRGALRTKVRHPGISPRPWLRPAFDAKSQAALDAMAKAIGQGIEKAIQKGGGLTP